MAANTPLVLVTGITSHVGSWVAYAALKVGYRVRGTVRNKAKIPESFKDICPGSAHKAEFLEANLTSDEGWDEAVAGCDYILHVASPFPAGEPKNPDELIIPAVQGTLRVMKAASKLAVPIKRLVLTSSVAAMESGTDKVTILDEDWTVLDSKSHPVSSYCKSKTLAEKAAWDFIASLPEEKKFELAVINPAMVFGPLLTPSAPSGSITVIKMFVEPDSPAIPNIQMGIVSVFDVARAHLLAMTLPEANGKRFMLVEEDLMFKDIAQRLKKEFAQYGYKVPTIIAPDWLLRILAHFGSPGVRAIIGLLGVVHDHVPSNAKSILGLFSKKGEMDILKETVLAAMKAGFISDKSPGKTLTSSYVCPEFDTSMIPVAKPLASN